MSVDLWAWRPSCDDEGCCGDCDKCKKAEEMEEEEVAEAMLRVDTDERVEEGE